MALQLGHRRSVDFDWFTRVVVALGSFDDALREPMPRMLRRWSWPTIQSSIKAWVRAVAG